MIGAPIVKAQNSVEQITIVIDEGLQTRYDPELNIPYWEIENNGRLRPPPLEVLVELFPGTVRSAKVELTLLDENDQPVRLMKPNGEPATSAWVQTVVGNPGLLVPDWRLRRPEFRVHRILRIHVSLIPEGPEAVTELFELKER